MNQAIRAHRDDQNEEERNVDPTEARTTDIPIPGGQRSAADDPVQAPLKKPFGGLSPSEAGKRSARAKRERREHAETEAAIDALTLSARLGTAAARALTTGDLTAMFVRLKELAVGQHGATPSQQITATKAALDVARTALALPETPDNTEGAWSTLNKEQKAARLAQLEAAIAARQEQGDARSEQ